VLFAVGVAVPLVAVDTPLRFDEDVGADGRAALNEISAFATALGIYVVARYGRAEFVFLLPGTRPGGAAFHERAGGSPFEPSQEELVLPLRVSEGTADGAIYEAKRRGKFGIFVPQG